VAGGRRGGQATSEDRRPVGQCVAAPHQRADDQGHRHRLLQAGRRQPVGDPRCRGLHRVAEDERLQHADADARGRSDDEGAQASEQGSGERRHDQQRGGRRIESRDRLDQDHCEPGEHRGHGPVDRAEAVRRDAEQQRPLLVARCSPCRQAEAGQAVHGGEPGGGHHDERHQQQPVLAHRRPGELHRGLGQHRPTTVDPGTGHGEPQPDDLLEVQQQSERSDHAGEHGRLAQRPEDQAVHDQADGRAQQDGHDQGAGQRRPGEQVHPLGQPEDGEHQVAGLAELEEGVGDVHAHRGVREVDHSRRPVAEHQPERERRHDGATAEPGEQESQVRADGA
jgi:hypothetical protein